MTRTAVICRWNSPSRQYKSEYTVGNPLFQGSGFSGSAKFGGRFIGGNRLIKTGLGGIRFEETAGAGQEEIDRRNALANVDASATGQQNEERQKESAACEIF